jgi:hypothetical protein
MQNYIKNIALLLFLMIIILDFYTVSPGLNVAPNQTYVYLTARNIGNDEPINSATFTLISGPAISTASLEILNDPTWVQFKPVEFNSKTFGVDLSSGIYFYSFEANTVDGSNSFRQTKKMILL